MKHCSLAKYADLMGIHHDVKVCICMQVGVIILPLPTLPWCLFTAVACFYVEANRNKKDSQYFCKMPILI